MTNDSETTQKATHTVELLVADDNEGEYSDLGSSIETDFTSLSSSIQDYVFENGRRYHALSAGKYVLPNDENEQERMDIWHHTMGLMLGGELHVAKLPKKLHRILDLGTGTGIWAIDMADQHPEAEVIGVDLSPIQPPWVPANCTFEVDDVEKPWLYKEPFDFIHSACIAQGIHDWPQYAKRIYDNLTPGGVVELHETHVIIESDDDSIPKGGGIESHCARFIKAAEMAGLKNVCPELEKYLLDAGFVDVRVTIKKLPIAPWPKDPKKKELGQWGLAQFTEAVKSYTLGLFTRDLGLSLEDANKSCDDCLAEVRRRDVHSYLAQWYVEGRKPDV